MLLKRFCVYTMKFYDIEIVSQINVSNRLFLFCFQNKSSRNLTGNHRGPIKKVRFAPGRGNLKLLVLQKDAVSIWDIKVG